MSTRRTSALSIGLCAALLGTAPAADADVTVGTVSGPAPVSYFAGRLAWSAFDPARNGYVLYTQVAGTTSPVPVRPRGVPFDVDLGPDEHGDTVAVYSRCGQEPAGRGIPQWRTGRGCDIFKFNFSTGRETRVASANGARSSEFLPSVWDTRIAFARVYERRKGRAGQRAYLYARQVLGAGASTRLGPGPRGTGIICRFPPTGLPDCADSVEVGPTALDLRGRRVAFSWSARAEPCVATGTSVWLDSVGGSHRRVDRACHTNLQGRELVSPTISGGQVAYVRSLTGGDQGTAGSVRRYRISSGRRTELFSLPRRVIMWSATDAGRTFYLLSGGSMPGCATDPSAPGTAGPCVINELGAGT